MSATVKLYQHTHPSLSRGAKAHKSHKDPSDEKDVISLQFLDDNEQRIKSKHAHEDGTSK